MLKRTKIKFRRKLLKYKIKSWLFLYRLKRNRRRYATTAVHFAMAFFIVFSIIAPFVDFEKAQAATATIVPNGDISTQWTVLGGSSDSSCAAGTHCNYVDEGSTPNTANYVSLGEGGTTGEIEEFAMTTVGNITSATSVTIYFYMQSATNANGNTLDDVDINLRINGTLQTATTVTPAHNSWAWYSTTFNGSWNQSAVDSFQLSATRSRQGGGNNANKDDDVQIASAYANITFTAPAPSLDQSSYRFFENQDASEPAGETFVKTLGGIYDDIGRDITTDSAGNYIVTGTTRSLASLDDMFITKFNSSGVEQWSKTWGGAGIEDSNAVTTDSAGNYIVTGATRSYGSGSNDMFITKFNSSGVEQWSKTWGGGDDDQGYDIITDSAGNYIVTGTTYSYGAGSYDMFIAKFNSSGVEQWSKAWGGSDQENGNGITTDSAGNYIVTGSTLSYGSGFNDMFITKFNSSGVEQWSKTWGGTGHDRGEVVITDSSGNYIVSGSTTSYGAGSSSIFITKLNSSGVEQWSKTWAGSHHDSLSGLTTDSYGNYIVAGQTDSYNNGFTSDLLVTMFNSDGAEQWSKTWGNAANDYGYGITTDSAGYFIITGTTESYGAGSKDMFIAKHAGDSGDISNCSSCQTRTKTEGNVTITESDQTITIADVTITESDETITESDVTFTITDICPEVTYAKTWGGSSYEYGDAVTDDSSGNYIITGNTASYGTNPGITSDMLITKFNSSGVEQWSKTWGGTNNDYGRAIATDSSDNYIVTGSTRSYGASSDMFITKFNSSGVEQWSKTWGGTGNDYGYGIITDRDGNYIVTGWTDSYGAGSTDMFITKFNSSGQEQWSKTWGGTGSDYGWDITTDSGGDYIVTGYTNSYGANPGVTMDMFITEFDSSGVEQWSKTWGGTGDDYGYGITTDWNGSFIVTGSTDSYGAGGKDMFITKFNSSGVEQWSKTWGGTGDDYGRATATADSIGDYIVTGYTDSYGAGNDDMFIVEFNSSGIEQWSKTWGGTNIDFGRDIIIDSSRNYIVTGETASYGTGSYDMYITKHKNSGDIADCSACQSQNITAGNVSIAEADQTITEADQTIAEADQTITEADQTPIITDICPDTFIKTWGGLQNDYSKDVAVDSGGNFITTGYTSDYGAGGVDITINKFNNGGALLWSKTWGGTGNDYSTAIATDSSNNYIIVGYTDSYGAGNDDMFIVKFNSSGIEQWSKTWGGTSDDRGKDLVVDSTGNYIISGSAVSYGNNVSFITKFNSSGIEQWSKTWNSSNIGQDQAMAIDTTDNLLVVSGICYACTQPDSVITKFNSSGVEQWTKTWGGIGAEYARDVTADSSGDYIVTGWTTSFGAGGVDMFISKFNSSGVEQWTKTWGGIGDDYGNAIIKDSSGNYIVTGNSSSFGAGGNDIFIAKFNSSGVEQWSNTWGGANEDYSYGIANGTTDSYVIAGNSSSYSNGLYDNLFSKHNSDGIISTSCAVACQTQTLTEADQNVTEVDRAETETDQAITEVDQTVVEATQSILITDVCNSAVGVGIPLNNVAQNTATSVSAQSVFRLRLTLHVSTNQMFAGANNFKLQYAPKVGTCDTSFTGETYEDVSSSGAIKYYDNPNAIDDMDFYPNGNDPLHSSHERVNQNYQEANNFSATADVGVGVDGLWDFALTTDITPNPGDSFCFRVVESSGSLLSTYTVIPEISISDLQLNQSSYRWYTGLPDPPAAGIARQNSTGCSNNGAATIGCTVTAPTNGNAMVAVIGTRGTAAGTVTSITQTGATWVRATQASNASGVTTEIWYALNVASAGTSVTVNLGSSVKASAVIAEYSGLETVGALDKTANTTGSSTSPSTNTTATTATTKQLWIGGMANDNTSTYSAQTNGFTEVLESASTGQSGATRNNTVLQEKIVSATGAANVSATLSATQLWAGAIATFKGVPDPTTGPAVGQPLAAQNTTASIVKPDDPIRLRMLLHVTLETATASSTSFKIQYAPKVGTCDTSFTGEVYQDLTTTSPIAYYNNLSLNDGAAVTTSANDPTHGADSVVAQSYTESTPFSNPNSMSVDNDYLWDFSLTQNGAKGGDYCFRIVNNNNALLTTYTQIPQLTLPTNTSERLRHGTVISERNGGIKQPFYWGQN